MERILIVEDDPALRGGIALALKHSGREVEACADLRTAQDFLDRQAADLVLLDIKLPDGSGLDFCRRLRKTSATPVIFLTANDTEMDEVMGLEAGGDDYITKPFSLAVLRARVDAALRRGRGGNEIFTFGDLRLDFGQLVFTKNGRELSLSKTEQRLLRLLVENRGRTLTRDQLLDRVWDGGEFVDENALSVAVRRLRGKLEDDPRAPRYIQTVYGIGYVWRENG